jgi:hypothetical protein
MAFRLFCSGVCKQFIGCKNERSAVEIVEVVVVDGRGRDSRFEPAVVVDNPELSHDKLVVVETSSKDAVSEKKNKKN